MKNILKFYKESINWRFVLVIAIILNVFALIDGDIYTIIGLNSAIFVLTILATIDRKVKIHEFKHSKSILSDEEPEEDNTELEEFAEWYNKTQWRGGKGDKVKAMFVNGNYKEVVKQFKKERK